MQATRSIAHWRTGLVIIATLSAPGVVAAQNSQLEYQFVESATKDITTPGSPHEVLFIASGNFLKSTPQRSGVMVLSSANRGELIYRDSAGRWNTLDNYSVQSGVTDAAVLESAGSDGLDWIATISNTGLRVHRNNESWNGTGSWNGFKEAAHLPDWTHVDRLFALDKGPGQFELHGYCEEDRTAFRADFDANSTTLVAKGTYSSLPGLEGMTSIEYSASDIGRELVFWTKTGYLIVTNSDLSLAPNRIWESSSTSNGVHHASVLIGPSGSEVLVWSTTDAHTGLDTIRLRSTDGSTLSRGFPGQQVRSLTVVDWDGIALPDLAIGTTTNSGDDAPSIAIWKDLPWPLDSATLGSVEEIVLHESEIMADATPNSICSHDIDNDGDQDLVVANRALGTLQFLFNAQAPSLRPHALSTAIYPGTTVGRLLRLPVNIELPAGYAYHPDQRLRLQLWLKGHSQSEWETSHRHEVLLSLNASQTQGDVVAQTLSADFRGVPIWNQNDYSLMLHTSLVRVNAAGQIVEEGPNGIYGYGTGPSSLSDLWNAVFDQMPIQQAVGGDVPTGSPPGDPPDDPLPSDC